MSNKYVETVRRLASAQKKAAPGAPAYSILVNRPFGRLLAAGAYLVGLTPNGVTAISALFTYTGIVLLATVPISIGLGIGIWLLLAVGYAFDSADGQVARLRGGGSKSGEWLDHVVDSFKIVTLHLAVLISAYRFFHLPSDAWLLVPIGFTAVASSMFFALILNDLLKGIHTAKTGRTIVPTSTGSRLRSIIVLPTDYGLLCLIFVTLGFPPVFFIIYSLLFVANAGYFALAAVKWFRDMAALDRPPATGELVTGDVTTGAATEGAPTDVH